MENAGRAKLIVWGIISVLAAAAAITAMVLVLKTDISTNNEVNTKIV
jgi:hypothetical protein